MDVGHRRLYLEWCQSKPATLVVDLEDGSEKEVRIPFYFLHYRSRKFRDLLGEKVVGEPDSLPLKLNGVSLQTIEDFVLWSLNPRPAIDEAATFEEATKLGIFAQKYHVPALSNQVTDVIRAHIASDEWQLQASIVDDIYKAAPVGSPLREVIRAALGKLPRSTMEGSSKDRNDWKNTVLAHAELGWDFIEARETEWTPQAYLSNYCRFHDHRDVLDQKSHGALCDGCPFSQEDCYPVEVSRVPVEAARVDSLDADTSKVNGTSGVNGDAVTQVSHKPVDGFADDTNPSPNGPRVGNSIMIVDPADDRPQDPKLDTISEGNEEPEGVSDPTVVEANGIHESEDDLNEMKSTVTSEDAVDGSVTSPDAIPTPTVQNAGTMTENGVNGHEPEEKAEEEVKLSKSKSKKKKKRGSMSVGTN
ncbi:uncharacterized protein HMPREF1541_05588 [Cyphellophora europaea CBS 101466]|uniref:BTB domain-containing protein n=1 Tax=Cyphellophora europaea (strain CBS 101466) TaxID=1220924 RepID=W2RSU7_CYPE1|nr:uncharacterized protein HMPREF1541_05588 [Cyphellophora europaea CBS 101466]ETN39365.1 hypothetical protein HMPREF1541_05588 [Cyphellophora europaea CBS 101466]